MQQEGGIMKSNELKSKRIKFGYTQTDVGQALSISKSSYSKKENGVQNFSIAEIKLLRKILEINDLELVDIFFNDSVAFDATFMP